ncbi:MAG: PKD domain-containing protein, partial [Saprospiraceae bacterium]
MPQKYQSLTTILFFFYSLTAAAQLDADFTVSDSTGCGTLQVSFCDNSTLLNGNFVVTRAWDLSGFTATTPCPGRIFSTPGNYTICLTVTDNAGNVDTECKDNIIQVFELP